MLRTIQNQYWILFDLSMSSGGGVLSKRNGIYRTMLKYSKENIQCEAFESPAEIKFDKPINQARSILWLPSKKIFATQRLYKISVIFETINNAVILMPYLYLLVVTILTRVMD